MTSHALALLLIIGVPLWDRWETRRLRSSTDPEVKGACYRRIVIVLWLLTALALVSMPLATILTPLSGEAPWLSNRGSGRGIAVGMMLGVVLSLLMPVILGWFRPALRDSFAAPLEKIAFFLPKTTRERSWFAAVSITAGICEELLYRGFLIRYFHELPWMPGLTVSAVLAAIVFGLGHGYQGWTGVVSTAALAIALTIMFYALGVLWPVMLVHALIDLRVLVLLRLAAPAKIRAHHHNGGDSR